MLHFGSGIVEHHLDPLGALERWTPEQLVLPRFDAVESQDFLIQWDKQEQQQIRASVDIQKMVLAASEVDALLATFMMESFKLSPVGKKEKTDKPENKNVQSFFGLITQLVHAFPELKNFDKFIFEPYHGVIELVNR